MKYFWIIAALLVMAGTAEATTRYASNTGTGASPCTTSTPASSRCNVLTMLGALVAGDTGQLLGSGDMDNPSVYTGANYMIAPASGKSGSSGNPITIGCYTSGGATDPGGCLIDGQFARTPGNFNSNNDWWVVNDINFRSGQTFVITVSNGSDNNVFNRIVAWDAKIDDNGNVFGFHGSGVGLCEDCAFFGTARKTLSNSQGGNSFTCRRCWIRWEGSTQGAPGHSVATAYKSYGFTCENCLMTWNGISLPVTWTDSLGASKTRVNGAYNGVATLGADRLRDSLGVPTNDTCGNVTIRGSISYVTATDNVASASGGGEWPGHPTYALDEMNCVTLTDDVAVWSPSHPFFNTQSAFVLQRSGNFTTQPSGRTCAVDGNYSTACTSTTANNLTAIVGAKGNNIIADYTGTNRHIYATATAMQTAGASPFQATSGTGARTCFQTVNGSLTTTPLWPWPMNARIEAATGYAGSYTGPCGAVAPAANCVGGRDARSAVDVTADIETLLGTIPSACRTAGSGGGGGGFPAGSGPTEGSLDTFSGSGMGGWTTISGNGWTESGGVAIPTNGFSNTFFDTTYEASGMEGGCEFGAIGTEGGTGFFLNFLAQDQNNRYRASFVRVTGTNNDTFTVDKIVNGAITTLVASTNLGFDIAAGDKVLAKVSGTDVSIQYFISGDSWYEVATTTAASPPSSSKVGMGAIAPWACTEFFGGGTETSGADVTAPTAPSNLTVSPQSPQNVSLSWTASTDAVGVTGYLPERGVQSDCSDCALIGTLQVGTTFSDGNVSPSTTYYYRVRATDLAGNLSNYSSTVSGRTPDSAATEAGSGRAR